MMMMQKDTTSRFLTVPLISDGTNTGFKTVLNPDYVDPCPSSPSYTLREISELAQVYTNEIVVPTVTDRRILQLQLGRFLTWLAKREREGLNAS